MDEEYQDEQPETKDPSKGLGRRGFIVSLGFIIASSSMLRRLPIKKNQSQIEKPSSAKPSITSSTTTTPALTESAERNEIPDENGTVYETVIANGRVIDPETGFDSTAYVAVEGKKIVRISADPIAGKFIIDAKGLVVAPGFIDILSYPTNGYGEWYKVADGVTSNLCMHGMDNPLSTFLKETEQHSPPVNYGGAVDHYEHRKILGYGIQRTSDDERNLLLERAERDLQTGALGVHQQPEYTVDLQRSEIVDHGHLAAKYDAPLCLHLRHSYDNEFGSQENAIEEALFVARETGCSIHIEHLNSTGGTGRMKEAIAQIQTARDAGLSVTACVYPYTFWATNAGSARFDNFQEKFGITFNDLQEAGKPNRLTEETFAIARRDNRLVAAYAMSEEDITEALKIPWVIIGSDAILERPNNNHPRSAGCFSRLLGFYVREKKVLSLPDAVAKVTILPANLLESSSSEMKLRGRLQPGAVADITMFDPMKINDRADISNPAQESLGVINVMVGGKLVRQNGSNNKDIQPGVPLLRDGS